MSLLDPEVLEYNPPIQPVTVSSTIDKNLTPITANVTDVVSFTIDARASFEVFMGKRYDPAEGLLVQQDPLLPSHSKFDAFAKHMQDKLESGIKSRATKITYGVNSNKRALFESPLERYTRLMEETRALQYELKAIEEVDKKGRIHGTTSIDNSQEGILNILTKGSKDLEEQLQALATPAANSVSLATLTNSTATSITKAVTIVTHNASDMINNDDGKITPLAALQSLQRDLAELSRAQVELQTACATVQQGVSKVEKKLGKFISTLIPSS
jgi:hypothetical protein